MALLFWWLLTNLIYSHAVFVATFCEDDLAESLLHSGSQFLYHT